MRVCECGHLQGGFGIACACSVAFDSPSAWPACGVSGSDMSSTASDCASARVRVDFIRQSSVPALHSRVRAPPFARRSRLHPRFARIHRIAPSRPLASLPFVRRRRLAVVSSASSNQIVSRRPIVARLPSSRSRTCSSRVMSGEYCVRFSSLNSDELIVVLVRALRRRVDDDDDEDRGERGRCRGRWDSLEVYNSLDR